jgi:hypothetical protein
MAAILSLLSTTLAPFIVGCADVGPNTRQYDLLVGGEIVSVVVIRKG